jgi:hypothetical protein
MNTPQNFRLKKLGASLDLEDGKILAALRTLR